MKTTILFCFLTAFQLVAAENLLKNGDFETEDPAKAGQPADWFLFTESAEPGLSTISSGTAHDGKNSLKLAFEGKADRFLGFTQELTVKPGQKLKFSCYVRNVSLQNQAYAQLGLEWRDTTKKEISRDLGEWITVKNTSTKDWTRFELTATAPQNTEYVGATVTLLPSDTTDGVLLIDSASLEIIP